MKWIFLAFVIIGMVAFLPLAMPTFAACNPTACPQPPCTVQPNVKVDTVTHTQERWYATAPEGMVFTKVYAHWPQEGGICAWSTTNQGFTAYRGNYKASVTGIGTNNIRVVRTGALPDYIQAEYTNAE